MRMHTMCSLFSVQMHSHYVKIDFELRVKAENGYKKLILPLPGLLVSSLHYSSKRLLTALFVILVSDVLFVVHKSNLNSVRLLTFKPSMLMFFLYRWRNSAQRLTRRRRLLLRFSPDHNSFNRFSFNKVI